ncbi:MAG: hypothetical protein STHCBS139747_002266 [Sporothrix thermara]
MGSQPPPNPDAIPVKKAYLDTPDGQVHYRYTQSPGGGDASSTLAPILLLHMSASSSQCFDHLMQALSARGYACYAPDMPGFGSSYDPVSDPPAIAFYADLYHAAFSGLPGFATGYHVVGHHSGGVIGTDLAAKHGHLVRSLTLVGPVVMSAEARRKQAETFLAPFNKPVASGEHLGKTWEYLIWEGLKTDDLGLLQREAIAHIRAWKGRSQIYSCVWAYDCAENMAKFSESSRVLALCAEDDLLWEFFDNVQADGKRVVKATIKGGNFSPDLDYEGILKHMLPMLDEIC